MKTLLTTALTGTLLLLSSGKANALYNGSLGSTPSSQGWFAVVGSAAENPGATGTTLDTTSADSIRAGYTRFGLTLNRSVGYNIQFRFEMLAENHDNVNAQNNTGTDLIADRAGLSIIVLSSDREGIELGFWQDRVWTQEDGAVKADPTSAPTGTRFTQAEGASVNNLAVNQYDLSILGSTYYLYLNGSATPLLSGRLRNYSPEGSPYTTPNFLYIGDNTTSARGSFRLEQVQPPNSAIVRLFAISRLRKRLAN
jgi:hypothetical protein